MLKILLIQFFLAFGFLGFSQELSLEAQDMKINNAEKYTEILSFAKNKWKDDHEMILYTVNEQCKAVFEISKIINSENYDKTIMSKALGEWITNDLVDYEMALYTYNNQIEAKRIYEPTNSNISLKEDIKSEYDAYLNYTSLTIKYEFPQLYLNIVTVVESQIQESDIKIRGKAINNQVSAMGNMTELAKDKKYNLEAMTVAITRNMKMKDGQALIDYIGVIKSYKEIIKIN